MRGAAAAGSHSTGSASPVSTRDGGEVEVGVDARDAAGLAAAALEGDGDLFAAQVVGVGEDAPGGDDHAAPAPPAAAEAHDGGADALGGLADGLLKIGDGAHCACPSCESLG